MPTTPGSIMRRRETYGVGSRGSVMSDVSAMSGGGEEEGNVDRQKFGQHSPKKIGIVSWDDLPWED